MQSIVAMRSKNELNFIEEKGDAQLIERGYFSVSIDEYVYYIV